MDVTAAVEFAVLQWDWMSEASPPPPYANQPPPDCYQPDYQCAEYVARCIAAGGGLPGLTGTEAQSRYANYAVASTEYNLLVTGDTGVGNARGLWDALRALGWTQVSPTGYVAQAGDAIWGAGGDPQTGVRFGHVVFGCDNDAITAHNFAVAVTPATHLSSWGWRVDGILRSGTGPPPPPPPPQQGAAPVWTDYGWMDSRGARHFVLGSREFIDSALMHNIKQAWLSSLNPLDCIAMPTLADSNTPWPPALWPGWTGNQPVGDELYYGGHLVKAWGPYRAYALDWMALYPLTGQAFGQEVDDLADEITIETGAGGSFTDPKSPLDTDLGIKPFPFARRYTPGETAVMLNGVGDLDIWSIMTMETIPWAVKKVLSCGIVIPNVNILTIEPAWVRGYRAGAHPEYTIACNQLAAVNDVVADLFTQACVPHEVMRGRGPWPTLEPDARDPFTPEDEWRLR